MSEIQNHDSEKENEKEISNNYFEESPAQITLTPQQKQSEASKQNSHGILAFQRGNFKNVRNWELLQNIKLLKIPPLAPVKQGLNFFFLFFYYIKAVLHYSNAIELSPNSPEFYRNRSQGYLRLYQIEKALGDVDTSISLELQDATNSKMLESISPTLLLSTSVPLFNSPLYTKILEKIRKPNSGLARAHARKAEIFFYLGMKKKSATFFEKAMKEFQVAHRLEPVPDIQNAISETRYYWIWTNNMSLVDLDNLSKEIFN